MKKILISPYTYIGLVFIMFILVAISNTYAWFNWQSTDEVRFEVKIGNVTPPVFDGTVNRPNIVDGMIPIKYNDTLNRWEKADSSNKNNDWYDYNNKKWANIVLVTDASRAGYISAPVGTEMTEANILAYLVWIPRYRYLLWNASNTNLGSDEQEIKIEFESTVIPPSCGGYSRHTNGYDCTGGLLGYDYSEGNNKYPILGASRMYESATNGTWLTHPTFRFGDKELDGIWVGKFETTGDITTPTIKPNEPSLRSQTLSSLFSTISKFKTSTSYGIGTSDIDSHMMKNIEWGAVAYLSHSKYGINSEIYINPSSTYVTGRSGNTVSQGSTTDTSGAVSSTLYGYDGSSCSTKNGYICIGARQVMYGMSASTTGNIYGIYDMSGGGEDYVMGNIAQTNTNYNSHIMFSRFSGTLYIISTNTIYSDVTLSKKYFDIYYNAGNPVLHNCGLIGDGTKETLKAYGNNNGGWYGDYANFPIPSTPWFIRGGNRGRATLAGIFYFGAEDGNGHSSFASRAVLSKY